jgi:hypothetical protein
VAKKLTLEMKRQISREVVAETKRCFTMFHQLGTNLALNTTEQALVQQLCKKMIEGCPYLDVHPELRKLVPKG